MKNVNAPYGFKPAVPTTAWRRYFVKQMDPYAYRVGDVVKSAGGSDQDGVVAVTLADGATAVRGVVVAIEPAAPSNGMYALKRLVAPARKTHPYYLWVLDDPTIEFLVRDDGAFPANLVAANVGAVCNFLPNQRDGDLATAVLSSYTFASGAVVQVMGLADLPDNAVGAFAQWRVRFRLHELSDSTPGLMFSDFGEGPAGPANISAMVDLVTARQVNKVGYSVLICGASTDGRANNLYNVANVGSYSRDAFGHVQFDCQEFPDADAGRRIKLIANNDGRVDALLNVDHIEAIGNERTRVFATEDLFGGPPRPAIAAGSVANTTMICHDLQSCGNCESWVAMLNLKCGGVLEVTNMGCSGSNPLDWNDPDRRAYIERMVAANGPFDTVICNLGLGNATTAPDYSSEALMGQIRDALTWLLRCAHHGIWSGIPGARPGGDDDLVADPQLSPDFTTLQRTTHFMRSFLAANFPTMQYNDCASLAQRFSLRGNQTTDDMRTGRISDRMIDQGGIHYAPLMSAIVSEGLADMLIPRLAKFQPFALALTDNVALGPVPDVGGRYNPNGFVPWFGEVPTVPITLPGAGLIGTAIEGTTVTASGLSSGMAAALQVVNGHGRGRRMRLDFSDNDPDSNGGAILALKYVGTNAHPLAATLNDPKFAGVCSAWLDLDVYGFNPDSVLRIEAELYGTTPSGTRMICAWLSDKGAQGMAVAQRAWVKGFSGPLRAGGGSIVIPQREIYSEAFLLVQITGVPTIPMGDLVVELGDHILRAHQNLLAA